jgi:hypothetical protein
LDGEQAISPSERSKVNNKDVVVRIIVIPLMLGLIYLIG